MSAQIKITVNGQSKEISSDQKPTHLFQELSDVVVCRINGELRDLWSDLADGDVVESVSIASEDGLNVLRHSTAHVLAQAVQEVFSETKLGIGPPIRDGFYYDFDPKNPFTPTDLEKLESAMRKIIKAGQRFRRRVTNEKDALLELKAEPYKCELIGLKANNTDDESSVEVGGSVTI
jgi:threonyl-tRNA synthetase